MAGAYRTHVAGSADIRAPFLLKLPRVDLPVIE